MKLSARDARAARACLLTASLAGVDLSFEPHGRGTDEFSLTLADGTTVIDQPNAAALAIAQAAAAPEKKAALLGDETDKEARAQIADWLSSVHSTLKLINDDALKVLNDALLDRTFLVASSGSSSTTTSFLTSPSLADVVVAAHVADACSAFPEAQLAHFPCVARWYDHVAALIGGRVVVAEEGGDGKPLLPRARLDRPPLKAPAAAPAAAAAGAGAGAAAAKGGKGDDKKKGGGSGAAAAAAAAASGAAAAPAAAAAAAPPAAAEGDAAASGGGGGKKEKKEKKPKAAPAAAAADAAAPARPDDAFDLLNVRVGKVVAAQKHPDADSLYQEEIDLGEASGPRTIVSGLAKWIPLEQFQGRMVCVVTNLVREKEKKEEERERNGEERGRGRERAFPFFFCRRSSTFQQQQPTPSKTKKLKKKQKTETGQDARRPLERHGPLRLHRDRGRARRPAEGGQAGRPRRLRGVRPAGRAGTPQPEEEEL